MNKISKLIDKINIEKIFPYVLAIYFIVCLIPYVSAPFGQIYRVIISTPVKLSLRIFSSAIFLLFSILVFVKIRPKANKIYLIGSAIILVIITIALFACENKYSTILTDTTYAYYTYVAYNVGLVDLLSGYASCVIDIIFGYIFLFIFPYIAKKENIKILVYIILLVCFIEIAFSLITEFQKYVTTIKGGNSPYNGYDIDIKGSFASKNQFGAFLVMGFVACILELKWYEKNKVFKISTFALLFLIFGVILCSLCKTAILAAVGFGIVYLIYYFIGLIKTRKFVKLSIISSVIGLFLIFLIVLSTTDLKNVSGFNKIFSLFNNAFGAGLNERLITWGNSLKLFNSYHIIVGYPKGVLQYALVVGTNGNNAFAHNGFIQQLLYYGVFGFLLLIFAYLILVKRIASLGSLNSDKKIYVATLVAVFSFMLAESEVLIMSSSLLVFFFNVLFSTLKPIDRKEINYHEEYI